MMTFINHQPFNRFDRWAIRVADLMTRDPVSIRSDATIRETINLLVGKGMTAAPVINEAGRPVGVLSVSDLVTAVLDDGLDEEVFFNMHVSEFMTPFVLFVNVDALVHTVVSELLDCKVHQMYVADDDGVLVGVLSTVDLLRDFHRHVEGQCAEGCSTAA